MRPLALVLGLACVGALPSRATAQDCAAADRWAESCSNAEHLTVTVRFCPQGGVVLGATVASGPEVRVELSRGRREAFRTVRGVGVSPVGEYPDWDAAPEGVREAFERIVSCVRRDPSLELPAGDLRPTGQDGGTGRSSPPVAIPWLIVLGALFAVVALAPRRRPTRQEGWTLGLLGVLGLATYFLRAHLAPRAFAHQNGQGPLWVEHALCGGSSYGPGYHEVLGIPASLSRAPDAAVFVTQGALCALAPICAYGISRAAGARGWLAGAIAVGVAADPGLARLAGSESYFATQGTLLLVAGAVLALASRRARVKDVRFLAGAIAAGLFVAQAARIHPVSWIPSAIVPLVAIVGPGTLRARLRVAAAATGIIGGVALAGIAGVVSHVLGGELGGAWLPSYLEKSEGMRALLALLLTVIVIPVVTLLSRRRLRGAVRATALALTVFVAAWFYVLGPVPEVIRFGYDSLHAAPAIAAFAACVAGITRTRAQLRIASAAVLVSILAVAVARAPALLVLPTDALEQELLREWRRAVPGDGTFAFVGVAGRRRLFVPLYSSCGEGPSIRQIRTDAASPSLPPSRNGTVFYYRSSLCTSPEARPTCERIERELVLDRMESARLPSRPSMHGLDYDRSRVEVALFRVRDRREP